MFTDSQKITGLSELAALYGFRIATGNLRSRAAILGLCDPGRRLIILECSLPEFIKVFVLAHELGHMMSFAKNPASWRRQVEHKYGREEWYEEELTAWKYADNLLDRILVDGERLAYKAFRNDAIKATMRIAGKDICHQSNQV